MMTRTVMPLLLLPTLAFAAVSTQTDWCAGPGTMGPVVDWQEAFSTESDTAWRSIPGQLALAATPRASVISTVIDADAGIPKHACVGDLNGDGHNDLVITDPTTDSFADVGDIRWYRWDAGDWVEGYIVQDDLEGAWHVDTVDLDLDGDLDVIAAAYYGAGTHHDPDPPDGLGRDGHFAWFENVNADGSVWEMHYVAHKYWGARYIEAGDIDGDGDIDLAGASELTDGIWEEDGDITWFENLDGDGDEWLAHEIETGYASGFDVHLGDIDGDGHLDIVGTDYDRIAWYENRNGDGSLWLRRFVTTDIIGAGHCDLGDIDNDGDMDVVGTGYNTSSLVWFENTSGSGSTWFAHYLVTAPYIRGIHVRDIDGDGDWDVYVARATDDVYWIEHVSGDGVVWDPHLICTGDSQLWVAPGDVNTDGKLDALVTDEGLSGAPQFTWHDLTLFAPEGELTSSILDGGETPHWGHVTWKVNDSAGSFAFQIRASNDPNNLGDFATVPDSGSDLPSYIDANARYLQYRLLLADDGMGTASPIIHEVAVESGADDILGDVDGDGDVDQADLGALLSAYNACPGDPNYHADANFTGDDCIGQDDLGVLLANYGFGA